jgi:hypothetical protein
MNFKSKLLFATILFFAGIGASAQLHKPQAAYIYNFTRFIEWPASSMQGEFVIGVLGKNHPITAELKASSAQRTVGSLSIKVVEYSSVEQIGNCQILFVPDERSSGLKRINEQFSKSPMLVITEEQDWIPTETTINFLVVDSKLAFKINQNEFKNKNIKVSDKLLALAK